MYLEGEKKFLTMPLDLPRFWVNRQVGQRLRRQLATEGEQTLHLQYRMDWERRPAWNILGTIPGYDPLLKEDVIVLEAYYDAMSVVPALAPGAEQASGITALLELARYFREIHRRARSYSSPLRPTTWACAGLMISSSAICAKRIPLSSTCW